MKQQLYRVRVSFLRRKAHRGEGPGVGRVVVKMPIEVRVVGVYIN
jgi:hypothetical protein